MVERVENPTNHTIRRFPCRFSAVDLIDAVVILSNTASLFIGEEEKVDKMEDVLLGLGADVGYSLQKGAEIVHVYINILEEAGGRVVRDGAAEVRVVLVKVAFVPYSGVIIIGVGVGVFHSLEGAWANGHSGGPGGVKNISEFLHHTTEELV